MVVPLVLPALVLSGLLAQAVAPPAEDLLGRTIVDVSVVGIDPETVGPIEGARGAPLTRSLVRASVDQATSPLDGIQHANRLICTDSTYGFFVTLFYGQFNATQHTLTYVNAGHNPPMFYQTETKAIQRLIATGMPLGIEVDATYLQHQCQFHPGDFIVLYTDGVTEAMNPQEEMFGMERLEQILLANRFASASELLEVVEHCLHDFIADGPRLDDITIVVAKRQK